MKAALILSLFFVSLQSHAGMFTWVRWQNGGAVKVCFAQPVEDSKENYKRSRWSDEKKALVQNWVQEEYSAERTGIHFYGFEDCVQGQRYHVIINYRKKLALGWSKIKWAESTLGEQLYFVSKDFPGATGAMYFYIGGLNKTTVTHEFGHVAGLYHEHDHPNVQGCNVQTESKQPPIKSRGYTQYDPESVMSYCVTQQDNDRGLSEGDVHTLRLMYIQRIPFPPQPVIFE